MNKTLQNKHQNTPVRYVKKNPLKLTALLYLREALLWEEYEQCPELIGLACELGAQDFEVRDLLEDPRRRPG
ncbi:MAG: hypothetical protein JW937_04690 [Candidatus Omnitrophica bacterium]|nr:hypothetical protein [Candidatus Omnitrophota bacterium]